MNNFKPNNKSSILIWLDYIEKNYYKEIDLSLIRVKKVANDLNLLNLNAIVFTVGGTNGKGSTTCIIEKILINSSYKVGTYTSPHLRRYSERIKINGHELPSYYHTNSFHIIESTKKNTPLTYFEYSTLSALMLFKQANVDIIILEVGLGGKLDATNIIDPNISIITNVDLDHTQLLGNSIKNIGKEKAGILRPYTPAILGANISKSTIKIAKNIKSIIHQQNKNWLCIKKDNYWTFQDCYGKINKLPFINIPISNIGAAISAIRNSFLSIKNKTILNSLHELSISARFQIIKTNNCITILDVAHNPHAAKWLSKKISSLKKLGKIYAIIGMLKDKNIKNTIKYLLPKIDYWYCTDLLHIKRAEKGKNIRNYLKKNKSKKFNHPIDSYIFALNKAKRNDIILVFGSFYTVSVIIKFIESKIFTSYHILI